MKNKIKINITDNFNVSINLLDDDTNTYKTKHISFDNLVNILNHIKQDESCSVTTHNDNFDSNVLYVSPVFSSRNGVSIVQHILKENNENVYIIKKEKGKVDFQYYNNKFNVHTPSLLFAVVIKDDIISSVKVFALKEDFLTENTELYAYPFSNVYNNGRICFGANNISSKKFKDFKDILSIPSMFLNMPSTHELRNRNKYNMEYKLLLEHLESNEFDLNNLISENYKLGEIQKIL